jgi:TolB-like protein/AraC-like DNA-binding protein/Tfp pilus assembly protein PilF
MTDHLIKDENLISSLTDIILANLGNENFGVNDLARQSGMSHFVLSRKLQTVTGKTINQFIREIRLKKALEILQNEDITAAEVAYKTGFGSPTYFNTCFNDFFGYPPGRVKKNIAGSKPVIQPVHIDPPEKRISLKRIYIYVSAGFVILIIIFFLLKITIFNDDHGINNNQELRTDNSIAVLPFKNLSDSAGNQYFADGITEDILTLLCRIRDLRVVSRTSVEQFRSSKMTVSEIAAKLKVKYIIEGSVQKSGNMFRLWIQLINATTGHHLWAEVYDGQYSTDIFDFQSRIAKKVARSLNVAISPKEEQKIDSNPTNAMLAHDLCMKGQELIRKWDLGGDERYLKLAINAFDESLKIDPDYITALLGKAQALVKSGSYDSTLVCCKKALAIDQENAVALGSLGAYYLYTNNPDSALIYFQKSNESNTGNENYFWNYLAIGQVFFMDKNEIIKAFISLHKAFDSGGDSWPEIHENISLLFSSVGDFSKALKYMNNSLSMTSACIYVTKSFHILLAGERYDEANVFIDSISRITPCEQNCDIMRFYLFTMQKKYDKADIYLNKAINSGYKLSRDDYFYKYCLDKGAGRKSEDLPILSSIVASEENLIKNGKSYWVSETALRVAAGYSILGDKKKAMFYMKMLNDVGFVDNYFPLRTFPGFDNLRNDPEFKAIIKRIEDNRISLRAQVKEMELREEINL